MSPLKQLAILAALGLPIGTLSLTDLPSLHGGKTGETAGPKTAAPAEDKAPVIVKTVDFASDAAVIEAVGTGMAQKAVMLFPEAAGQVSELLFSAGQRVKAGAPLLRLDAEEEKLAVKLARLRLQDARQTLSRYEQVAPSGAVSTGEVDAARTALSAARIELSQAELALENRTLIAPFAGMLGIPQVEVGDRVTDATPIATLDDRSSLLIDFDVPEAFAGGVAIGGEIEATTWALPGHRFEGTIEAVASRIDPDTRTLRVRAKVPNAEDRLRTGMSFSVRLPLAGDRFPAVPSVSLQWDGDGAYVWRVRNGVAERLNVSVLKRSDGWVLVDAPLSPRDQVVVEGLQRLRHGLAVDVKASDLLAATARADDT